MNSDVTKIVCAAFEGKPEALEFIAVYSAYVNAVDDAVDEDIQVEHVSKLCTLANAVYNSRYWTRNMQSLYLLERVIHSNYFASLTWEDSAEKWKQGYAKFLAQSGLQMVTAVAIIELGETAANQLALSLMHNTYTKNESD